MILSWANLAEAIRNNNPLLNLDAQANAEAFFPALTRSLHVFHRYPTKRMAEVLGVGVQYKRLRVLDVTCGSGVWGIALAQADSTAHVTMQDFPALLDQTRIYLVGEGVEAQKLFKDLHQALVPGGRVAIIDMIPNDDRSNPPFPLMFALTMFLHTDTGSTYTLAEYKQWLLTAGFTGVETVDIGSHSLLIIATKYRV
jgi:hypothetical protein